MKILHIASSYWPAFEFGGPIQSVHLLNKFLAKQGIEITVFTTNAGLENKKNLLFGRHNLEGIEVVYFPYIGTKNFNYSPELKKALKKEIENFDLVHITGVWNYPIFAAASCAKKHKKPYMVSPRGTLYKETFFGGSVLSKIKKSIYWPLVAKKIIKNSESLHFTTQDEAEKTIEFLNLKNNYFIVPNGLDLGQFLKDLPQKGYFKSKYLPLGNDYILILGRLSWKKGFDILVPAFAEILKEYPNLYLAIVGPDEKNYQKTIKKLIQKNNIKDRVIFTGLLKGKEKLGAYLDAKAFVLPSYSENFGMVALEAMACGLPTIISNQVGIYKEVEKHQAGLIARTNPKSISWALLNVLKNPKLASSLSENGKNLVKQVYDIKEVAKNMAKEYDKIVDK